MSGPAGLDGATEGQHRKRRLGYQATPVLFERRSLDGVLVIATDGLFNYARPEVIAQAVATHEDLDATARALVEVARSGSRAAASWTTWPWCWSAPSVELFVATLN